MKKIFSYVLAAVVFVGFVYGSYFAYRHNLAQEIKRQEVLALADQKGKEVEDAIYSLIHALDNHVVTVEKNMGKVPEQYLPPRSTPDVLIYRMRERKLQLFGESVGAIVSDMSEALYQVLILETMLRERGVVLKDDPSSRSDFFDKRTTPTERKIAGQEYEYLMMDFDQKRTELERLVPPPDRASLTRN